MPAQAVTLHLPQDIYERLPERAARANRPVEAELADVVVAAVFDEDLELPPELAADLERLGTLDDAQVWQVARSPFPPEAAAELEALNLKRQRVGLAAAESARADELLRQLERAVLLRAHALATLKQRGYDVSELLAWT